MKLNVSDYLHLSIPPCFQFTKKTNNLNLEKVCLVVRGCLLVVCGHLLVVCGCLLLICGRLLVVCGSLWSFAGGLWLSVMACGRCLF